MEWRMRVCTHAFSHTFVHAVNPNVFRATLSTTFIRLNFFPPSVVPFALLLPRLCFRPHLAAFFGEGGRGSLFAASLPHKLLVPLAYWQPTSLPGKWLFLHIRPRRERGDIYETLFNVLKSHRLEHLGNWFSWHWWTLFYFTPVLITFFF